MNEFIDSWIDWGVEVESHRIRKIFCDRTTCINYKFWEVLGVDGSSEQGWT